MRKAGISFRLPQLAVQALSEHYSQQVGARLAAGALWQDHGLVFATSIGTSLDRHNVLREFRKITEAAGPGTDWVPRELRHTFVSLLSSDGMPLEDNRRPRRAQGHQYDRDGLPEGDRPRTAPWRRSHGSPIQLLSF